MQKLSMNLSIIWKIILVSGLLTFVFGCDDGFDNYQSSGISNIPDEQSDSVTIVTLDSDIITMKMKARHIDRYYKKKITYLDSLYLENYDENGKLKSTLVCDKAEIDENHNDVICKGNVVVTSANGILKTPKLTWDRGTDKVVAENGVTLKQGDDTLWGERMRTDMELNDIEIVKVSAVGTVKSESVEW